MEQSNDGRQNGDTRLDERPDPLQDTYRYGPVEAATEQEASALFDGAKHVESDTTPLRHRITEKFESVKSKSQGAFELIREIKLERTRNMLKPTIGKMAVGAGIAAVVGGGITAKRRHDIQKRTEPKNLLQRATGVLPFRR